MKNNSIFNLNQNNTAQVVKENRETNHVISLFEQLPEELVGRVGDFLDIESLKRLRALNRSFRDNHYLNFKPQTLLLFMEAYKNFEPSSFLYANEEIKLSSSYNHSYFLKIIPVMSQALEECSSIKNRIQTQQLLIRCLKVSQSATLLICCLYTFCTAEKTNYYEFALSTIMFSLLSKIIEVLKEKTIFNLNIEKMTYENNQQSLSNKLLGLSFENGAVEKLKAKQLAQLQKIPVPCEF